MTTEIFLQYDLPSILLGVLAALACGLIGNFLVLRRQSLIGDAISHVALPGIVAGFLFSASTDSLPMMIGAGIAAIVAVGLIELVRHLGRIEPGAAMGVVFTAMFALGVVVLEQTDTSGVHLDVQHALLGNLESAVWFEARSWGDLVSLSKLMTLPNEVLRLFVVNAIVVVLIVAFLKELRVASFDSAFSDSVGISSRGIGLGLVVMTAVAAVAAFNAVGSILVIAMFICPAATARLLTDNLVRQIWISAAVAIASGVAGYGLAATAPVWLGTSNSVSAAGMIAVTAGLLQFGAILFAPRYGVVPRRFRERGYRNAAGQSQS